MGVSLFGHCISFISITYFDQLIIVWFWLLAIISPLPVLKKGKGRPVSRKLPDVPAVGVSGINHLRTMKT